MQLTISTDDLTSATDGLANFADRGWSTSVLRPGWLAPPSTQIASIDTDSRTGVDIDVPRRIREAGISLDECPIVAAQFDSTLRGHIVEDCKAFLEATHRRRMVVMPAFPGAGRTTVSGVQFVNGVPIHATQFARDPLNPMQTASSSVVEMFRAQFAAVSCVRGTRSLANALESSQVAVVDAEEEAELDAVVEMLLHDETVLWAGSTGLMRSIARVLPGPAIRNTADHSLSLHPLIVIGSRSEVSRRQAAYLERVGVVVSEVSCNVDDAGSGYAHIRDDLRARAKEGRAYALTTPAHAVDPRRMEAVLSHIASRLILDEGCDGLVVTGGSTANQVLQSLGVKGMQVIREIATGIPICTVQFQSREIPVVTKAGGFGAPSALADAVAVITGRHAS